MNAIHEPAVAGSFYPGAAAELTDTVAALLDAVQEYGGPAPKALIVPHAGYIYSGPTAAAGYARLKAWSDCYERVILVGPCHQVPVRGLAASGADAFRTPLGDVPVDTEAIAALDLPVVEAAHRYEHSLEVHLPFLQRVLRSFSLLPFSVGDATADEVAEVLEQVWGGDETLIVVSSDLSHYHDYETARRLDRATTSAIESLDPGGLDGESACGRVPVRGLLVCARRRGLEVETVDVRNSGDTAGGRDQVVGYGSWIFRASSSQREAADRALLAVARQSIERGRRAGEPLPVDPHAHPAHPAHPAALREIGATFVTLKLDGKLRGCIGSLDATLPVVDDVSRNAYRAAYHDPRFEPVSRLEGERLQIHISLLGPPVALSFSSEEELVAQLSPGVDGLILRDGSRYATFLPDVWEQLPDPREFLAHLKQKAGLAVDYWSDTLEVSRYATRSIG
jgi:AmmeMemoRadiSam system protein B/AmmeMemoRadiSam system protein A